MDRQPGRGAHDASKKVKRKSAEIARDGKSAEIVRDGNDPVSSHKSAEIAQDGNTPFNNQRKSAEIARPGQEISSLAHRSGSMGDAIAAFVGKSRSSTLRVLREVALAALREEQA